MRGWADVHVHMFSNLAFGGGVSRALRTTRRKASAARWARDYASNLDFGLEQPTPSCPAVDLSRAHTPNCGRKRLHGDHTTSSTRSQGKAPATSRRATSARPCQRLADVAFHDSPAGLLQVARARVARRHALDDRAGRDQRVRAAPPANRLRGTDCRNSMPAIDKQLDAAADFQNWLDSQSGGAGKGWFRIVEDAGRSRASDPHRQARGGTRHRSDTLFGCKQKSNCNA